MNEDECYEYYDEEIHPEYSLEEIPEDAPPDFSRMKSQSSMIFLKLDDMKKLIDKKVEDLSELLGATFDETLILFHHFKWSRDHLENSEWFSNREHLRRVVGLDPIQQDNKSQTEDELTCPICLVSDSKDAFDALSCGHSICKSCWENFINDKVNSKETEFFWKCPGHFEDKNCNLIILDSFNRKYLKPENELKYVKKLCISYAEESKAIRWCPAPDCQYAVENPSLTTRAIKCRCSLVFCFRCGSEDHQPCDCDMAAAWESKNLLESKNTMWISLYTKNCPKCKKPIEKHQGCNHMICGHIGCKHEFCWICLDDWKTHVGSFYKCNKFDSMTEEEKKNLTKESDKNKSQLEKYVFYFERYLNNDKALGNAKELQKKMESIIKDFHDKLKLPYGEITFLLEAAEVLARSRRILKWTYPYAFYLENPDKKNLFEFHQKDLERYCEELHELLEIRFSSAIKNNEGVLDLKHFLSYKDEVVSSYVRTQKFSTELIRAVEVGL